MAEATRTLLLIEDQTSMAKVLTTSLRARGFAVRLATTGEEGLVLAATDPPDVVVLDLGLPDIDGLAVDLDLDIRLAKIETLGHQIIDSFYVVDADGAKVVDATRLHEIERAVLHGIAGGG